MTALALSGLALAGLSVVGWAGLALALARTRRWAPSLDDVLPGAGPWPSVSVIVPCRDEARGVEAAVRSLLAQDLPGLEVIAVDDRSTDATGAILDRLAAADRRLRVVHVDHLPDGWLGKNHACAVGAARATGELLLFTDGDVLFAPDALRRATALLRRLGVGHLTVAPRLLATGPLERAFVAAFGAIAAATFRAWELPRAGTRGFAGVGAFNLVGRGAYQAAGGHARLRLEVVDDVKLGLLLRRSGVPQALAGGGAALQVRWQHGFLASALGLVKNTYAALEYRPGLAALAAAWLAFLAVAPLALTLAGPGAGVRVLAGAALLLSLAVQAGTARRVAGGTGLEAPLAPVSFLTLAAVVAVSAASATLSGGVAWRGTRYPLAALRAGALRERDLPVSNAPGWPDAPPEPAAPARRAAP